MQSCYDPTDSIPIEDIVAEVQIRLPDVAPVIIENEVRRSIVQFANRARNLVCEVTIPTEECVAEYEVQLPPGFVPKILKNVSVCGVCIDPIGDCIDRCSSKQGYISKNSNTWIELIPAACCTDYRGITLQAAVGLTMDVCDLPSQYYHAYGKDIINGVLSELYGMFGEPWYDVKIARYYIQQFYNGISAAKENYITDIYGDNGIPIKATLVL